MNKNIKVIIAIATLGVFGFSQIGLAVTKTVAKPHQPQREVAQQPQAEKPSQGHKQETPDRRPPTKR